MAEAVGLAISVVGILDTLTRASKHLGEVISTWRNAPDELLALRNELEDMRVVLDEVQHTRKAVEALSSEDGDFMRILGSQITSMDRQIHALEEILYRLSKLSGYKQRLKWLRKEGHIEEMKVRVRESRESIRSMLLANNVLKSSQIEREVVMVRATQFEQDDQLHQRLDGLDAQAEVTKKDVSAIHDSLQQLLTLLGNTDSRTQLLLSTSMAMTDTAGSHKVAESGMVRALQQLSCQFNTKSNEPLGSHPFRAISFTIARRQPCQTGCGCQCHSTQLTQYHWRLPKALSALIGTLFFKYNGSPVSRGPICNLKRCLALQHTKFYATYTFPDWFIRYSIIVQYMKLGTFAPNIVISMRPRFRESNPDSIFRAGILGDILTIQRLCRKSPWMAQATDNKDGITVLHLTIKSQNIEAMSFLISAGADMDQEDDHGESSRLHAALWVLETGAGLDSMMGCLFKLSSYIDEFSLPKLTQAILRLPGASAMAEYIRADPEGSMKELESLDDFGRTPLLWACRMGDAEAVRRLLELGANPNKHSRNFKEIPMSLAVKHLPASPTLDKSRRVCLELLHHAGGHIQDENGCGNALITAIRYAPIDTLKRLVEMGGDIAINSTGLSGQGAMHAATRWNNVEALELFINAGGSLDVADNRGHTPLFIALAINATEAAEMLLARGVNYLAIDSGGATILHFVAAYANAKTMRMLAKHGLSGLDVHARESDGQTAQEFFEGRPDKDEELSELFGDLFIAIKQSSSKFRAFFMDDGTVVGDEEAEEENEHEDEVKEEEEEVFFDAMENVLEPNLELGGLSQQHDMRETLNIMS